MGFKGDSVMDCGYFGIDPYTGDFRYWPPTGYEVGSNGSLEPKKEEYKPKKYTPRSIDDDWEVQNKEPNYGRIEKRKNRCLLGCSPKPIWKSQIYDF